MRHLASILCGVVMVVLAPLDAQVPLDTSATALRSHLALEALDRYLETWNSRDPRLWASSLHYPHIRPSAGVFEMSRTPEEYAAGVNFNQTVATGWHHTEWDSRRVLQVALDKVHATGQWTRYTLDGRPLTSSVITYIVTNDHGRWGVLSRFAVGGARTEAGDAARATASALQAITAYFVAWNAHDPMSLANAMHFPHVRLADSAVEVWNDADAFLGGAEPGRQRTWPSTTVDRAEVVQVNATAANVTLLYTRRGRGGEAMSTYEGVFLVTQRGGAWKVQARSLMGP